MTFVSQFKTNYANLPAVTGYNNYTPQTAYKPFSYSQPAAYSPQGGTGGYDLSFIIQLIQQLMAGNGGGYQAPAYTPAPTAYNPAPAPYQPAEPPYVAPQPQYEQAALVGRFRKQTHDVNRIISDYNGHAKKSEFDFLENGMKREIQEVKDIAGDQNLGKIKVTGGEGKKASFTLITKNGHQKVSQEALEKEGTILDPKSGQYIPINKDNLIQLLERDISAKHKYGSKNNTYDDIGGMLGHYYAANPNASIYYKNYDITAQIQSWTPVMLDLDGNGFNLTFDQNTSFDLNGDGQSDKVSWVAAGSGDAILALDRNGNGTIDSGKELFGDQHGAKDGYAELAKFDENGDGVLNAQDSVFGSLSAWIDGNGNGVSEAGELKSMADVGLAEISIGAKKSNAVINGNEKILESTATLTNGQQIATADILLNALAQSA